MNGCNPSHVILLERLMLLSSSTYLKISEIPKYCIFDKVHQKYCMCFHSHIEFNTRTYSEFDSLDDASSAFHMVKYKYPDRDFVIKKILQKQESFCNTLDNDKMIRLHELLKEYKYTSNISMSNILSEYDKQKFLILFSSNTKIKDIKKFTMDTFNEKTTRLSATVNLFYTNNMSTVVCFKLVYDGISFLQVIDLDKMEYVSDIETSTVCLN